MNFIIPLTKIDEEKRLIIGRAAQEVADKSKEIMDYATAKPAFEAWSKGFEVASGGLSKGNLRVMHTKTVAGKVVDLSFHDGDKAIDVVVKVVDDNEWEKVLSGCYTGFSMGGGYAKRWNDDAGLTRYTPTISEISLVDNPCIPTARFAELVKADGLVEQIALHGRDPDTFAKAWAERPRTFGEAWASRPLTFGELIGAR